MISFIIWVIGLVLTVKAGVEIWQLTGDNIKKILIIIAIILTNWIGLIVYYFYAKDHVADWIN